MDWAELSSAGPGSGGGGKEIRTPDIMLAKHVLYQLSYTPGVRRAGRSLSGGCQPSLVAEYWWAYVDSNHRPPTYQAGALTN
jgi:hypothetical protein